MSKRPFLRLLLVILALALTACGGKSKTKSGATQPADATLSVQADRVEWQSGSTGVWTALTATQTVRSQDSIRTDVSGSALLNFYTGTQAEILPGSEVTVSSYEQTASGGAVITLKQLIGDTRHRVQMVADTGSHYEIDTPVAQLTVRGTEFSVSVAPDGATRVEVTSGIVRAKVGLQQYDINPGQGLEVNANQSTNGPAQLNPILPPNVTMTPTPAQAAAAPTSTITPFGFAAVPSATPFATVPVIAVAPTIGITPLPLATAAPTLTPPPTLTPLPTIPPAPTEGPQGAAPVDTGGQTAPQASAPPAGSIPGEIAFTSYRDGSPQIYAMSADGTNARRLTDPALGGSWPSYSPDGSQIAFEVTREGYAYPYLMLADGSQVWPLGQMTGSRPVWSPDSRLIVFIGSGDGALIFYYSDPSGQKVAPFSQVPVTLSSASWSPDGTRLAFTSSATGYNEIYVMDVRSGTAQQITQLQSVAMDAAWSPDGSQIAFESSFGGTSKIYLMNPDGSGLYALTYGPGSDSNPTWSPDGQWIAFVSYWNDNADIYVISRDGKQFYRLTDDPSPDTMPAWRPAATGLQIAPVLVPLEAVPVQPEPTAVPTLGIEIVPVVPLEVVPLDIVPTAVPTLGIEIIPVVPVVPLRPIATATPEIIR
jgi:hypothetical protein